ncbi:MAG: hypothetical protein DHS20C14_11220 [Phycisphaeraceae bacterium]|nr:MAG: hypothetical protein DHS20C14_11220 [Phycisphaeraceae bacterium]
MAKMPPDPRQAVAYCNRGINALNAGNNRGAIPDLAHAAELSSDQTVRGTALKGLGTAYARLHHHAQAIDAFRQAESIDRKDPMVPMYMALSLRTIERVTEAVEACKRVRKIDPDNTGAISLLIDCLVRARRDDEAWRVIEESDRLGTADPNVDEMFAILALRSGREEEALARLRRHEAGHGLESRDHARVMFALGDVLDATGQYEEAWQAYDRANHLKGEQFDPDMWLRSIDAMCDVWSPELIARLQEGASEDDRAVLVVGMPRSGTTLVELTLGRHGSVHMGGEMTALGEVFQLITARIGGSPDIYAQRVAPEHIGEATAHYSGVMDRIGMGAARVTNKMPMNVPALGLFAAMYPNGRIVHCRRDPRDVCLSCYFRNFRFESPFTQRPDWLAAYYEGYARLIRHWGTTFAKLDRAPSLHEVKYEEMVADHETHARALVDALGLGWDPACLDVGGAKRDTATLRADQIGKGVYTTSAGRHTNYAAHLGPWADLAEPSFTDG